MSATRPHPKIAARVRRRRWRAMTPLLAVALVGAVLVTLAWVALGSGLLDVKRMTVTGTSRLSAAEVSRVADVTPGSPMLTLDTGAAQRRVARLAPVASVTVSRSWPSTVRIAVVERRPVASVPATSGGVRLLDRTGVAFATTAKAPAGVVPLQLPGPVPGRGAEEARAALDVLEALPSTVRAAVRSVSAPTPAAVTLTLAGNRRVVWGGPEDSDRKARVLAALLKRPAHEYDVSAPGVAVTR